MITTIRLVNTSITSCNYLCVCVCVCVCVCTCMPVCVLRACKTYCLSNFQVHNSIVNYSHHAVHYVLRTFETFSWKYVHFDHLLPFSPPASPSFFLFLKMIIWVHSGNACQETCIISLLVVMYQ